MDDCEKVYQILALLNRAPKENSSASWCCGYQPQESEMKLNENLITCADSTNSIYSLNIKSSPDSKTSTISLSHFQDFTNLTVLQLDGLSVTGDLESLANLTSLAVLRMNVQTSSLGGTLDALKSMANLGILELGNQKISGFLPRIDTFPYLEVASLANNRISGDLAQLEMQYGGSTGLDIYLSNNNLSGFFDPILHAPFNLLDVSSNSISGHSPVFAEDLGGDSKTLRFTKNRISGFLDFSAGAANIKELSFGSNMISGHLLVPTAYQIQHLNLQNNRLSGYLQSSLLRTDTTQISLDNNKLSGTLDALFEDLSSRLFWERISLDTLTLSFNHFSGFSNILSINSDNDGGGCLSNLKSLDLSMNSISGNLNSIDHMSQLEELRMASNAFSGGLSHLVSKTAPSVSILDVQSNNLDEGLGILTHLKGLVLFQAGGNSFKELSALPDLSLFQSFVLFNISANRYKGILPSLWASNLSQEDRPIYVDISNNSWTCPFPIMAKHIALYSDGCEQDLQELVVVISTALFLTILSIFFDWYFVFRKKHWIREHPYFDKFAWGCLYTWSQIRIILSFVSMSDMFAYLEERSESCDSVNTFSSFRWFLSEGEARSDVELLNDDRFFDWCKQNGYCQFELILLPDPPGGDSFPVPGEDDGSSMSPTPLDPAASECTRVENMAEDASIFCSNASDSHISHCADGYFKVWQGLMMDRCDPCTPVENMAPDAQLLCIDNQASGVSACQPGYFLQSFDPHYALCVVPDDSGDCAENSVCDEPDFHACFNGSDCTDCSYCWPSDLGRKKRFSSGDERSRSAFDFEQRNALNFSVYIEYLEFIAHDPSSSISEFSSLCSSVSRPGLSCLIQEVDGGLTCAVDKIQTNSELYPTFFLVFYLVFAVLIFREVLKFCLVLSVVVRGKAGIPRGFHRIFTKALLAPLLTLRIDLIDIIVSYKTQKVDIFYQFIFNTLLFDLPQLCLTLWFAIEISGAGISSANIFSTCTCATGILFLLSRLYIVQKKEMKDRENATEEIEFQSVEVSVIPTEASSAAYNDADLEQSKS